MNKLPSMPFLVDSYLNKTTHLSLEEHGFYILLLCHMWKRGGTLDDNDTDNARMLGIQLKVWLRLKQRLMPELIVYGGKLTQEKLQKQWNYAQENRAKQSAKGKLSVKYRNERKQGLESIRSSIRGLNKSTSQSSNHGTSPSQTPVQASLEERNIPIPLSNTVPVLESAKEPTANSAAVEMPELPAHLDRREQPHRLLNTNLMRKTG